MVQLTVAVASALIAAGIAILQFVLPNALALVLSGTLCESERAVTISVVLRSLLSSDWPLLSRSETATSTGVPKRISVVTWTKPLGLLLIAIAAIVTPLGLHDEIGPMSDTRDVHFAYISDSSLIGSNTPARSSRGFNFSRTCASFLCIGDPNQGNITTFEISNYTTNETEAVSNYVIPKSISPLLIDLYQSGLENASSSLSSFFDIQPRQWRTETSEVVANNDTLLAMDYKYLSSVLMNDRVELVEGLIVDTVSGGIGFRNHSVPAMEFQFGVEWEEDILWMQPESACVDSNISVSYTGVIDDISYYKGDLVDRGGFVNLQKINPYYTPENTTRDYVFADAQPHPYLRERAYYLAWTNNAVIMEYLNITDPKTNRSRISSTLGQRFRINDTTTEVRADSFSKLQRTASLISMPSALDWNSSSNSYSYNQNPAIPNPHNTTSDAIFMVKNYCKGALGGDKVNISTLDIGIGYIVGPAVMLSQADPSNASSPATWERPCYVCASATKASIKTVRFRYNSTRETKLTSLEVMSINDKTHLNEAGKPLWGLETPWMNATTTWNLSMINPLWGLVDPDVPKNNRNVTSLRSEHFYIPASRQTTQDTPWSAYAPSSYYSDDDYTAAMTGPSAAWSAVFRPSDLSEPYTSDDLNQQVFMLEMTKNTTSVSKLIKLMWTDMAANAMVGTRGLHSARYHATQQQLRRRDSTLGLSHLPVGTYPVYPLGHHLRYRWGYGIPALLCILLVGSAVIIALVGMIFGEASIARLKRFMFSVSSGRILAAHAYPETQEDKLAETKQWIQSVGLRHIQVYGRSTSVDEQYHRRNEKNTPRYTQVQQMEDHTLSSN